jgi:hypothetical protein
MLPQQSSVMQHYGSQGGDERSNQSNSRIGKPLLLNSTANLSSAPSRTRFPSEFSNKRSGLVLERRNEYCPPFPTNIVRLEPIRRISQHKVNISQMS